MVDQAHIEGLLELLLTPNNDIIRKATEDLKKVHTDPGFIPSLCHALSSANTQVRQYAAVLLRRRIIKRKHWTVLDESVKTGIKEGLLQKLVEEPQPQVRNSLAQLIGTIAHHCDELTEWPQLVAFLNKCGESMMAAEKDLAMNVLKTISAEAPEQLGPYLNTVLDICTRELQDSNLTLRYYAVLVLNNVVLEVDKRHVKKFSALVPQVLKVVTALATEDEQQACEAMDIFDSLVESDLAILQPHVKTVVDFCLALAMEESLPDSLRVKALECISWLVSMKRKAIQKMNLLQPILDAVFSLMCRCDDDDDDMEDSEETEKAASYAARIMDSLALHLPPEKIVSQVVRNSKRALESSEPRERKAGYVSIGIIAEGCSDYIGSKYLKDFLHRVLAGLDDPHQGVRNGAMFALGQFAENLQPNVSKHASEIIPILLKYAEYNLEKGTITIATATRTYFALEAYLENLEKDVLPYLPQLMTHLLVILDNNEETELVVKLKEFALSCIASIACSAKTTLNPYFDQLVAYFKKYLADFDGEKVSEMQLQVVETLGVLAREMDEEKFTEEMCNMCIQLGLSLINGFNDPDVRRCVYNLFASLATLKTADLASRLPAIVTFMLQSLRAKDGVRMHFAMEDSAVMSNFSFESSDQPSGAIATEHDDDSDSEGLAGISIESPYLDEKEDACLALSELAINYYENFMPFINDCFTETLKLEEYGSTEVLKTSLKALANFAIAVHDYHKKFKDELSETALKTLLQELMPRYFDLVLMDKDRSVAMTALHSIQELLESVGEPALQCNDDTLVTLTNVVKQVLKEKTECQVDDYSDDNSDEEDQAEYDIMLVEVAAGILPLIGTNMKGDEFDKILKTFMPMLIKKCRVQCSGTERGHAIGTIAECIDALNDGAAVCYFQQLLPILQRNISDNNDEVRNNAVFAIGILFAKSSGAYSTPQLIVQLETLCNLFAREQSPGVMDNIQAAVARMVSVGHTMLPLKKIWPTFLGMGALREDFSEYETIIKCFCDIMYSHHKDLVMSTLPQFLPVLYSASQYTKLPSESQNKIHSVCHDLKTSWMPQLENSLSALGQNTPVAALFRD